MTASFVVISGDLDLKEVQMSLRPIAAVAFLSASFFSLPVAAIAQEQGPDIVVTRVLPPSKDRLVRVVYIGDLDLKADAGRQEMEKRVADAVKHMCAIPSPIPGYKEEMERPCSEAAWASARPQMDGALKIAGPVQSR
jgi:UrcA family protein